MQDGFHVQRSESVDLSGQANVNDMVFNSQEVEQPGVRVGSTEQADQIVPTLLPGSSTTRTQTWVRGGGNFSVFQILGTVQLQTPSAML